ncbi:MAG: ATP-grasp domain-containing protein, partial [Planctomycetota bacterium]|jgi:hypothetical protein|nr:ATP-grasp domain-containing protein [Planctomycetota bacterium]
MLNVLVFPCGSEIGLELQRSLAKSTHFRLFGASSLPDHGRFAYANYREIKAWAKDRNFLGELNQLLRKDNIRFLIPAHDSLIPCLAEAQEKGELAAEALVPSLTVARLCRSKSATYRRFTGLIPVPVLHQETDLEQASFPLFAKPDAGQGSRGASILLDTESARQCLRLHPDRIIMNHLPGREYTVDCFSDHNGRLLFARARERLRISSGISVRTRLLPAGTFQAMAEAINRELTLTGAWFFQVKEDREGLPTLLEIAPRIAGASGINRALGVNLPLLSLFDRLGKAVEIQENSLEGLEYDRSLAGSVSFPLDFTTLYVDLDDTLVRADGQIDTDLVKLLFQCLNRGIHLVLLTRHSQDPALTLTQHRLDRIFDQVVWIPPGDTKSQYIRDRKAILIDDSFAERREVAEKLGIPVFDPAAVETILDKRY